MKSKVMGLASQLTDIHAPRLSGTQEYLDAAQWIEHTFKEWGYENVVLERFEEKIQGWSLEQFSLEQISPNYKRISGYPVAWTRSIKESENFSPLILLKFKSLKDFKERYHGKLTNKILLLEAQGDYSFIDKTIVKRFSDTVLNKKSNTTDVLPMPPYSVMKAYLTSRQDSIKAFYQILEEENAAALLVQSNRAFGVLRSEGTPFYRFEEDTPVSSFVISNEDFGRIKRTIELDEEVRIRISQKSKTSYAEDRNVNVIVRLDGYDPDLKNEVVMIGAHLDTWHAGTGATDNSGSCAALMEVGRILKKIGPFKRSIVIAFWGGEEQGVYGSTSFANKHLGSVSRGVSNQKGENVSTYLNLDNGSGKIRGIYLQGNQNAIPFFSKLFKEFLNPEDSYLSLNNSIGSDHMIFDLLGIPSFQFIQDPNGYGYLTHHTNLDVYEYLIEEDLNYNVNVIAKIAYLLGNMKEKVPRK